MPFYRRFLSILFLSASALASSSELTIKVVDPQSAPVPHAQVEVITAGSDRVIDIRTTSAQGLAQFHLPAENFRVHVLAPAFAEQWRQISAESREPEVTVQLRLAVATETVTVTATRTSVPAEQAGAAVDTLTAGELETTRPVAGNDTLRFLPGAVVATAGQRGGLGSLFVRGGDSNYNKVIV
jgi:iron complex outermembrane receptor protein/vitamin B12 transporter